MKKIGLTLAFLLIFTGIIVAQSSPRVTIVNNTGYTIFFIYMSQTGTVEWEEDVLDDFLSDGDSFTVTLSYPLTVANRYDIMLEDEDGDTYTKMDVLITPDARIIFTQKDLD